MKSINKFIIIPFFFFSCIYFGENKSPHRITRNDIIPAIVGIDSLLCDFLSDNEYPRRIAVKSYNLLSSDNKRMLSDCLRSHNISTRSDLGFISTVIPNKIITPKDEIHIISITFNVYQVVYKDNNIEYFYLSIETDSPRIGGNSGGYTEYNLKEVEGKFYLGTIRESLRYL